MADHAVTRLLIDWGRGDQSALDRLMPLVYSELRLVARNQLRFESPGHTLQPTALVHEAYLRLIHQQCVEWRNRAQFFAISARLIRRILVDHARQRAAAKRGGMGTLLQLDSSIAASERDLIDALILDQALVELAELDEQQARTIELRFYAGLSIEETAAVLGVSPITVSRDWVTAKAWLYRRLISASTTAKAAK